MLAYRLGTPENTDSFVLAGRLTKQHHSRWSFRLLGGFGNPIVSIIVGRNRKRGARLNTERRKQKTAIYNVMLEINIVYSSTPIWAIMC